MKKVPNKIREYIKDLNNKESFHILTTAMGFTPTEAGDILNVYIFDDLQFNPHGVVPGAVQATLNFGETSFEVLTSEAEDVEGHIGKDRVTEILLELQEDDIG